MLEIAENTRKSARNMLKMLESMLEVAENTRKSARDLLKMLENMLEIAESTRKSARNMLAYVGQSRLWRNRHSASRHRTFRYLNTSILILS